MASSVKHLISDDVVSLLRNRKRFHAKAFSFIYKMPSKEKETIFISVIVSKKVKKSAVERNMIKRKIRGIIERNKKNLKSFIGLFHIKSGDIDEESVISAMESLNLFIK